MALGLVCRQVERVRGGCLREGEAIRVSSSLCHQGSSACSVFTQWMTSLTRVRFERQLVKTLQKAPLWRVTHNMYRTASFTSSGAAAAVPLVEQHCLPITGQVVWTTQIWSFVMALPSAHTLKGGVAETPHGYGSISLAHVVEWPAEAHGISFADLVFAGNNYGSLGSCPQTASFAKPLTFYFNKDLCY